MNIDIKLSFKDIIQQKKDISTTNNINNEKRYSYEEYNELLNKKEEVNTIILKDKLLEFIDEHLTTICNKLKSLKDIYDIDGYLNNSTYKDIIDILISNINVDEIISEHDENEQSWDDDEN